MRMIHRHISALVVTMFAVAAAACGSVEDTITGPVAAQGLPSADGADEFPRRSSIVSLDGYLGDVQVTDTVVVLTFAAGERYKPGLPEVVVTPEGIWKVALRDRTVAEYGEFDEATTHRDWLVDALSSDPLLHYEGSVYDGVTHGHGVTMTLPRGSPRLAEARRDGGLAASLPDVAALAKPIPGTVSLVPPSR